MSLLRIAGAAAVFLSLGLLARAAPIGLGVLGDITIGVLASKDAVSCALNKLIVELDIVAKLNACLNLTSIAEVQAALRVCVDAIKLCTEELLSIGVVAEIDARAKADIVATVAAIITLFLKVCLQISLKFGVALVATVVAEVDVCIKALLVSLNICIDGIIVLVVKAITSVSVGLFADVGLRLCASIFASLGVTANVGTAVGL
ncbi:hypothetical protein AG1IA_07973 [Rhizoctonia solani AG-1 IA]|uniref:Transmembrane protein n=1 Tax=Thanatephorus cucumeris (strain AG1-IA) TaxID=983506 RepID=L8WMJ0_THACA|nr:hypothetical protein AG1IA_07973 [Rhizoctonia solani AG-1 IA]